MQITTTAAEAAAHVGITEDRLYEIADAIELVVEAAPVGTSWTPSTMGRKVKANTYEARTAMDYLVANIATLDADYHGAWTRYFPLTNERRTRKLYR